MACVDEGGRQQFGFDKIDQVALGLRFHTGPEHPLPAFVPCPLM